MKWVEIESEIKEKKKEFMNQIIQEIELDKDSAGLLRLISEISNGDEFVEPDRLKPELGKVGVKLFDPQVTKSVQTLYEKGFVRLGIAINNRKAEDQNQG
jgi:hypothetical protein